MPTNIRTLGVHGKNAPTKSTKKVQASDFGIAGIIGLFERKYAKAMLIENQPKELEVLGVEFDSATYGKDTTKLFWANLKSQPGKLYVKSHVSADAVIASKDITDQNDGLESALLLANDLKTVMNAHAADGTIHTTHKDDTNFPVTTPSAQELTSLLLLTNALVTAYIAHEADAAKASAWSFHKAQETGTHALTSSATVTTLANAITMLNDLETKYKAHDADGTAHNTGSQHQIATAQAAATPAKTMTIQSAYKGELDYGTSGNRTGVTIENGVRYTTKLAASMATSATSVKLVSVIGIKVGDIVTIYGTGATPGTQNVKVTEIDETAQTISWTGAIGITGTAADVADVPGFKIHTWRKGVSGLVNEVETALGKSWCTMEPEVTEFYVQNVHAQNRWILVTDESSSSTNLESFPENIVTVEYLAAGANGTAPTTSVHWALDLPAFDGLPVRLIANCETSDVATQKAVENYCANRDDTPVAITVIAENQTADQLKVIGAGYQRSDDVFQVNVADWFGVTDPYNSAANAPDRIVPNVGAVMGAWLRSIATKGIHYIPSTNDMALYGINSIYNSNLGDLDDEDRTALAEYGINIIQFVNGSGFIIRNFFTPSTALATMFANGILMRNFIKVSAEDSLKGSENTPNSMTRIKNDADAITSFMRTLWDKGSTGSVPSGETFGQQVDPDTGAADKFEDHVEVLADAVNNPVSSIEAGERTLDVYFTYPAPSGSIQINVGILLQ